MRGLRKNRDKEETQNSTMGSQVKTAAIWASNQPEMTTSNNLKSQEVRFKNSKNKIKSHESSLKERKGGESKSG